MLWLASVCRLLDPSTNSEISYYKIHCILFCARGPADSPESSCFAFTCSHGKSPDQAIFQCHVFRCDNHEAVSVAMVFPNFQISNIIVTTTIFEVELDKNEYERDKFIWSVFGLEYNSRIKLY